MAKTLPEAVERYRALARLRDGTEYENERSNASASMAKLCAEHPELEARIAREDAETAAQAAEDEAAIGRGFASAQDEQDKLAAMKQRLRRQREEVAQEARDRENEDALRRMREEKLVRDANWGGGCGPVPLPNPRGVPPVAAAGYTSPTVGGWRSPTRR